MWIFISKHVLRLLVRAVYKEDTKIEIKAT